MNDQVKIVDAAIKALESLQRIAFVMDTVSDLTTRSDSYNPGMSREKLVTGIYLAYELAENARKELAEAIGAD